MKVSPGLVFTLRQQKSGFALFVTGLGKGTYVQGYLMAEKSKQMRVFAKVETALRLLQSMHVKDVSVVLLSVDFSDPIV